MGCSLCLCSETDKAVAILQAHPAKEAAQEAGEPTV